MRIELHQFVLHQSQGFQSPVRLNLGRGNISVQIFFRF